VASRPPQWDRTPEILVWWKGRADNGDLMLLLAHLLSLADDWRDARVTLASITPDPAAVPGLEADLQTLLDESRISASVEVLEQDPTVSVVDTIHIRSRGAALVFVGLARVEEGQEEAYAESILQLVGELPHVILVRNGDPHRGRLV
jgi:hypothetical protein